MERSATALTALADEVFERRNCYPGAGERNHCLRLVEFTLLHARRNDSEAPAELVYLAAMLHDLGLMVRPRPGSNYLSRTVELARLELEGQGLSEAEWLILEECLLFNHALRPPRGLTPLAEAFRRAVFTEHSRGALGFGLDGADVRAVFRELAWDNFGLVLADFVWKTAAFEPWTIPGIFLPGRRRRS